jgi:hypothetical protein
MTPVRVIAGDVRVGESITAVRPTLKPAVLDASALARPKFRTFTIPSDANFDIGGFQVSMNGPLLVGCFERIGDLASD